MKHRILMVAGARPNFVKIAPLAAAFRKHRADFETILVHTGQHYDYAMSESFFQDLAIPKPDEHLGVGSGSHAVQTARILESFEPVLLKHRPNVVLVVGDVNSTIACAMAAAKLGVKVAHVEAGLRSFDTSMPEEINRVLTDRISDFWFVSEPSGVRNLSREGVESERIDWTGNVMIDALVANRPAIRRSGILDRLGVRTGGYGVLTLHRPINVDDPRAFARILGVLETVAKKTRLVFPIHPRTLANAKRFGLDRRLKRIPGLVLCDPLGYLDFLRLIGSCAFALTDSGGIQEETTYLRRPCITLRPNTERPVTLSMGTNVLAGEDPSAVPALVDRALAGRWKRGLVPPKWDGRAAERIVSALDRRLLRASKRRR